MEYSLYKLYLVTAAQGTGGPRNEKVTDFLAKMLPELQGQNEWKDWFSEYQLFVLHYIDMFMLSLKEYSNMIVLSYKFY